MASFQTARIIRGAILGLQHDRQIRYLAGRDHLEPIGSQPSMASASCGVEPRKSTVWELTAPGSGPKNSLLF